MSATATRTAPGSNGTGAPPPFYARDPLPHQLAGRRYDFARALAVAAEDRSGRFGSPDGLELETHQELVRRTGRMPAGFLVPLDAMVPVATRRRRSVEQRDLLAGSTGAGAVQTNTQAASLVTLLRSRSAAFRLGAQNPMAEPGDLRLPRLTDGATAYWVTEPNAPAESAPALDAVVFTPRTVGGFVDVSRKLISSSSDAQGIVIGDLMAAIAAEVDRVALVGGGTNEPEGLLAQLAGDQVISLGTDGGALTWASLCAGEAALGNLDVEPTGFAATPNVRERLRQTLKLPSDSEIVWSRGEVLDVPAVATTSLPSSGTKGTGEGLSAAALGDFGDLVIPFWQSVADVIVDPFKFGGVVVRVIVLLDVDVNVRRPESFVAWKDVVTAP